MDEYESIVKQLAGKAEANAKIPEQYYRQYDVKRGLRNSNGTGVLVGLTEVCSVEGYEIEDGKKVPREGRLYYRGYDIKDVVYGFQAENRLGFEETAYLLMIGDLPTREELKLFHEMIAQFRELPEQFTENMILKIPSRNIMNKMQRSVLTLYSDDDMPDDTSVENILNQSVHLIARFPSIISYAYQAKAHYFDKKSLFIHQPSQELGTAENILLLSRQDCRYTKTEAETLDLLLVIHAEHGGGNNSAFTTRVVSSSGTDTYSAISAAIGSLKGPKHGGANFKVFMMAEDIKANCSNWKDRGALKDYLVKILNKEAFDGTGLIYGMGHAVYTLSDPRAVLLKEKAKELAIEKDSMDDFNLYSNIEELTKEIFSETRGEDAVICANVDLYSGFVYQMLSIPIDLHTPLFAMGRLPGWCAHRIEQMVSDSKIIRPAYKSMSIGRPYINMKERLPGRSALLR
jgi:citrate synthase